MRFYVVDRDWIEYINRIKAFETVWKSLWFWSEVNWLTIKFIIFSLESADFIGPPILMTDSCLHTGAVQFVNLSSFQAVAVQSRHCQFVCAEIQTSIANNTKRYFTTFEIQVSRKSTEIIVHNRWNYFYVFVSQKCLLHVLKVFFVAVANLR